MAVVTSHLVVRIPKSGTSRMARKSSVLIFLELVLVSVNLHIKNLFNSENPGV
jgi:hypothetical protein